MIKKAILSLRAKRSNLIIIFLLILPFTVYAEDNCQCKDVKGEALADTITVEDAGRLALKRARLSATEQVGGVVVFGSTAVINSVLVQDFVMTLSQGYIIKEEILKWEAEFQKISDNTPPIPLYRVYARCCVSTDKEDRDTFFTISVKLNKPVFISGEKVKIEIKTSRGAYISIFQLSSEEKLCMLLPNEYQEKVFIEEGKDLLFPPKGLGMTAEISPDKRKDIESFIVVATKEWFDFEGQLGRHSNIPITSFFRALLSIKANMRAIAIGGYEVVAKE